MHNFSVYLRSKFWSSSSVLGMLEGSECSKFGLAEVCDSRGSEFSGTTQHYYRGCDEKCWRQFVFRDDHYVVINSQRVA